MTHHSAKAILAGYFVVSKMSGLERKTLGYSPYSNCPFLGAFLRGIF